MMEHETREKAKNAVKLILEAAGFEVEEVDEPLDLSASRDGECVAVLCSVDPDIIAEFDRTNYDLVIGGEQVPCKKLLFTIDTAIHTEHCVVWGVREFVRLSGEATLARVLDRELSLTLIPGAVAEAVQDTTPEPVEAENSGASIPHLPVKITKQNAERISGIQGNAILKFMPHWVYHYMSSGEQVYQDHRIPFDSEGWGAINAINGLKLEIDSKTINKGEIPGDAEVVGPKITKEEANTRVFGELVEQLTQHVRIKQVKGDTIFYEEKVMKPEKKNISIDIDLVHFPVWQIRGKKIVEVNAYSGEVLSQPMDEGCEIL
jgi:hypothetical protein